MNTTLTTLFLLAISTPAFADDRLTVCYHYGCKLSSSIVVSATTKEKLTQRFAQVSSAETEREAIRDGVQMLYLEAGTQSPIYQDKGGNFHDGLSIGRMDCVDNSTNTTTFLNYMQSLNLLHYYHPTKPIFRLPRIIDLHYAAQIENNTTGQKWAVDTWFKDFGNPPAIIESKAWKKGWRPQD